MISEDCWKFSQSSWRAGSIFEGQAWGCSTCACFRSSINVPVNWHFSSSQQRFFSSKCLRAFSTTIHPVTSPLHKGQAGLLSDPGSRSFRFSAQAGACEPDDIPFACLKRTRQLECKWSVSHTKDRHPFPYDEHWRRTALWGKSKHMGHTTSFQLVNNWTSSIRIACLELSSTISFVTQWLKIENHKHDDN